MPIPRPFWESYKCGGQHVITFQIADEIRLILKKSPLQDHVSTNSLVALSSSVSSIVNTPISFCCCWSHVHFPWLIIGVAVVNTKMRFLSPTKELRLLDSLVGGNEGHKYSPER